MGPGLARKAARRRDSQAGGERPALPAAISRQWSGAKRRRLVSVIRCAISRQTFRRTRPARAHLVSADGFVSRCRNSTVDVPRGPFHVRYPMPHPLEELRDSALREIAETQDESALEAIRVRYLGRSGSISVWGEQMKTLSKEDRPVIGRLLNEARVAVTSAIA